MKYLIACPIYGESAVVLRRHMDFFASGASREVVHQSIEPHLTLHPPITGVPLEQLKELVADLAQEMVPVTVQTGAVKSFGVELLVLPLQALELSLAKFWAHLDDRIFKLLGKRGEYNDKNTLHITLIGKLSNLEKEVRVSLAGLVIYPISIPLTSVAIYQRVDDGPHKWQKVFEVKFG
jgi:2'-5' RNA ligase